MARGSKAAQLTMLDQLAPAQAAQSPPPNEARPAAGSRPIEPSPENFRIACHEMLAMLRGCEANPWNRVDARYYRVLFRLRSEWLPEEEGGALRDEFMAHWRRLGIVEVPLEPAR